MGALDVVIGPILIGTMLSVFLTGILVVQSYNYFIRFGRDPTWMKVMVAYFLITDLAHTAVEMAITYQYTITFFGQMEAISFATPLFSCIPLFSVTISSPAQCFFGWRVNRLTRVKVLGWLIFVLALVQFLCGIGVTIAVTRVTSFFQFSKFQAVVIPWLSSSVLCDLIITFSLCLYLSSHRSGIPSTDDVVTKLIRATIQTGFITAIWAILDLIIYRVEDNSLHVIFNFPLAKIYTNSLLSTLTARRAHSEVLRGDAEAGVNVSGGLEGGLGDSGRTSSTDTWGFKIPKITSRNGMDSLPGRDVGLTTFTHGNNLSISKHTVTTKTHDVSLSPTTDTQNDGESTHQESIVDGRDHARHQDPQDPQDQREADPSRG